MLHRLFQWLQKQVAGDIAGLRQLLEQVSQRQALFTSQLIVLSRALQTIRMQTSCPGPVLIHFAGESSMPDLISFRLSLPAPSAPDVVTREILISFADGSTATRTYAGTSRETDIFEGPQDTEIFGSLTDIDDGGLRSLPREFSFALLDTVPPPQPGAVGIEVVGETQETPVAPEPPADGSDDNEPPADAGDSVASL